MGSFFGRGSGTQQDPPSYYLRYSSSVLGRPKAIGWGRCRVAANCIWYGGFYSVATQSGGGGKGGLFGGGSSSTTTYTYFVNVVFSIGEGPIAGLATIYQNNAATAAPAATATASSGTTGLLGGLVSTTGSTSIALGTYAQNPWSFLTAKYPSQALAYRGEAYYAVANFNLGSSSSLPNMGFEVIWGINNAGYDANPADVIIDFLTNQNYGVPNFDPALLDDFTPYRNYCTALGLVVSTVLSDQTSANTFLQDLATATNSEFRWSSGLLNIVPYADTNESGNGATYTASVTPVYDLTTDNFKVNQGSLGSGSLSGDTSVVVARQPRANLLNHMRIEFLDRSILYNPNTVESWDEASVIAYGDRPSDLLQMHMLATLPAATRSCALQLARAQIATTYQFTLGAEAILLDPMDIVTLTEPALGLLRQAVRITEIQENDDQTLTFTADEFHGTVSAPLYGREASAGAMTNYNADPGSINTPLIFEPPIQLAGDLELWIAVSGVNIGIWGGCNVYASSDGNSYTQVGQLFGSSRMGFSNAAVPAVPAALTGQTIDATNPLAVDLSESAGALVSGSQNDMVAANTAMIIGGEVVAFQTATLVGANKYSLSPLLRGAYGTPISAHPSGTPVARLDEEVFKYPYTPDRIGSIVYLKFQSFNIFGGGVQDLSVVGAVPYLITGSPLASAMLAPQNVRTVFSAGFEQLSWDEVKDFRTGIRYLIYRGDSAATAQQVGDVAHPPFTLFGAGTYYVVAYCQPTIGITVTSPASAPITIVGNMLVANSLKIWDQATEGWTGTLSNLTLQGTAPNQFLALATGRTMGVYLIPPQDIVDLGYTGVLALNVTWKAVGVPLGQDVLSVPDFLGQLDVLGSAAAKYVDCYPEVQIGIPGLVNDVFLSPDEFAEPDTFAAPIVWGPWQKFLPGNYLGRYANFRITITTTSNQASGTILSFVLQAAVGARIDHYQGLAIPAAGLTITFTPDGSTIPATFNGGPNGAALPYFNVTYPNAAGDVLQVTSVSLSSLTIQILNGGVGVARSGVNLDVQGY